MVSQEAVDAYAVFLERLESGEEVEFEAFLAANPDQAADLARLHERREKLLQGRLFAPRPRERTAVERRVARQALAPVLGRLGERTGFQRRYRILGRIQEGGMGRVLRVFDRDLRRVLAMKLLTRETEGATSAAEDFDAHRAARLLEEAQITSQLDHPGIPPIHEVGLTPEGELYFTMKLITSERTLQDVIEELHAPAAAREWNLVRVLALVQRACEAVAYAHERGVIHRDLKPANVLIGDLGEVYVSDWGVARALGPQRHREIVPRPEQAVRWVRSQRSDQKRTAPTTPLRTLEGHTVGTPEYMSPEQARGRLDQLDARSDVYSMGALLRHVLTGQAPAPEWTGRPSPKSGSQQGPRIPAELEAICKRAMSPSPAERYADMHAMTRDLAAFLEGGVVQAYETGAFAELKKWVRRNKGVAAASGLAVMALVLGVVVSLQFLFSEQAQRARAETQLALQALERGDARAREHLLSVPEGERAFEWHHLLARADSSRLVLAHSESVLEVFPGTAEEPVVSVSADGSCRRWSADHGRESLPATQGSGEAVRAAARSPDGLWLATLGPSGLRILSTRDGSPHPRLGSSTLARGARERGCLAFAPDGLRLAVIGADQSLFVLRLEDGASSAAWPSKAFERCLAWAGADLLAVAGTEGKVRLVDASSGALQREWPVSGKAVRTAVDSIAACLSTGELATGDNEGMVRLWSPRGEQRGNLVGHGEAVLALAFDPEGQRLASGSSDRSVRLWDVAGRVALAVWAGHTGSVLDVAFDPSGREVLSASEDRTVRVWLTDQEPGVSARQPAAYPLRSIRFSPDGRRFAVGSAAFDLSIWDSEHARGLATLRGHEDRIDSIQWTPEGRYVLTASADDRLALWDVLACERVRFYRGHEGDVTGVALDPAGGRFVSASADGSLRSWDLEHEEPVGVLCQKAVPLKCVGWSRDGKRIAAGTSDGWLLYGPPDSLASYPIGNQAILRLAFAADGRLALGGEDGLFLWDADEMRVVRQWLPSVSIQGLAFSPDGERLACASYEAQRVYLCDPRQDAVRATFPQPGRVSDLDFAPDGSRLATVDMLGTLRLFETRSPQELELVRGEGRGLAKRMEPFLGPLFDQHLRLSAVRTAIEGLSERNEHERQELRRQADFRGDDPARSAGEALEVLETRASVEEYSLARRKLEIAVELDSKNQLWKTLLGAAHARLGKPQQALELIPDRSALGGQKPRIHRIRLAMGAKALAALGRTQEAEEHAQALRELIAVQASWAGSEVATELLEDVERWLAEAQR